MPRKREYPNQAARQRAYRQRLRERASRQSSSAVGAMVSTPLTPFRVVDEGGNPLLEVGRSDGTTFFRLYDGEGNVAIMLLACGGGGGVFLLEGPQQVAAFYAGGDGGTLELRDADGEIRFAAP